MVLYRRKPVNFEPLPRFIDDNTEVWLIDETGEVFVDYEKFLNRRDFYDQKKFTCESTGHTGYTFFEAKESESEASREINSILPDALRARVLEHVQFENTSRMDDLVNQVYDHFKEDFMVEDRVSIDGDNVRRFGKITAMTDMSRMHNAFSAQPMDQSNASYSYEITLDDNDEKVIKYRAADLQRDKDFYSKLILKNYLRYATKRESWVGAPWTVLEHLARRYNISTRMPDLQTRDAMNARRRAAHAHRQNGTSSPIHQGYQQQTANGHPPQVNGHRPQMQAPGRGQATFVNFSANAPQQYHVGPPVQPPNMRAVPPGFDHRGPPPIHNGGPAMVYNGAPQPYTANGHPAYLNNGVLPPPHLLQQHPPQHHALQHHPHQPAFMNGPFQTSFVHNQAPRPASFAQPQQTPQLARPFEIVKYPMEDLEIKQPKTDPVRPTLKFFCDDVPEGVDAPPDDKKTGILMKSLGPLLCVWETLNVHDTVYSLDSFTFDDFVDAMRYADEETECELFVEVHCSILKQIINISGKFQTDLPKMADAEESEDEDSSKESSPTPEPEPPVRTTRSSLRKSEAQQIIQPPSLSPEPPKDLHSAEKFLAEFNWIEQCKTRNFREGGWQSIVVALLYRLSFDPIQKGACDDILAQLVPADEEPTMDSIANNYVNLDVNLRISALELILRLTVATEAFRDQLSAAAQEMTRLRKEKIEFQRKRKELADELFKLDLERKILLPANTPASPITIKDNDDVDVSMASIASDVNETSELVDNELEEPSVSKSRLRQSNKNKRKAAAEEARKEKAKKTKLEAEKTKKQKEWEKLLDSIEKKKDELKDCEANINELDDDLRETLVHRSKVLGKDRFLNKYYWFEHNGMPFGGVPNSSTAEYGYANGRIWVQGPDKYELQANLEEPAISQDRQRFGFDIPQRKRKEEGDTHLISSTDWAYYDKPEDIDNLVIWLDERGTREKPLRKELMIFRDRIAKYMDIMNNHLSEVEKADIEDSDEDEESTTRISTRNKTNVNKDDTTPTDRCLAWTNSIMRDELGYNHSEEYEPPKKGKAKPVKAAKGKGRR